jgi:hypothetical protein
MPSINGLAPLGFYIASSLAFQSGAHSLTSMPFTAWAAVKKTWAGQNLGDEERKALSKATGSLLFLMYLLSSYQNNLQMQARAAKPAARTE